MVKYNTIRKLSLREDTLQNKDGKFTLQSAPSLFALELHRISPMESSVVWSIYGAGGKLRPTPCPVLMNGLFVGLWKQAESFHLPPYGQAYTSPVAWGPQRTSASSMVHLWALGSSCCEAPTGQRRCFCPSLSFHFCIPASSKPSLADKLVRQSPATLHLLYIFMCACTTESLVSAGWACLTHIWDAVRKQTNSLALQFLL